MGEDDRSGPMTPNGDLLGPDETPAVTVINRQASSPFLLTGDHSGNLIPRDLGTLGLTTADRGRHIALDIGVGALGAALAAGLEAVFVRQTYSRLVIDCNRDPASPEAIPAVSDGTAIPGNARLGAEARARRVAAIHAPYQAAIGAEIARRQAAGQPTILIALHSFTPVIGGIARPWEIGVLHNGANDAFARGLLARLQARRDVIAADNEPYRMDATDYTVPRHAFAARLPYAELEIRQDLLADDAGVARWAAILAEALPGSAV